MIIGVVVPNVDVIICICIIKNKNGTHILGSLRSEKKVIFILITFLVNQILITYREGKELSISLLIDVKNADCVIVAGRGPDESFIKGVILVVVKDSGPEIVANLSPIPEENALITALHLVSLAGLEEESRDEDDSKMIGPLPVKSSSEYKSLFYSNYFKAAEDIEDARIQMHGSKVGVILLFDADKLPAIRRAAGLIEPYLELYLSKANDSSDFTKDFAIKLREHIIDIISKPRLRTFYMTEESIHEYKDPNFIKQTDDVMILDESDKTIYLLTQKETSVFSARKMVNKVNEYNFSLYQGGYTVVTLEKFGEIETLLLKHNIKVI